MNRFALIGASYKSAGVDRLGQLALPKDQVSTRLRDLADQLGVQEVAYVGTCNRLEFVVAGDESLSVHGCRDAIGRFLSADLPDMEIRKIFRAWVGEGAAEHLFLVASGLDSAQAGEREIYAQVRSAWLTAREAGTCGPQLDYLFAEALKAAQDVHRQASAAGNPESLASYAVKRGLAHLNGGEGRIALVGISPMTRHCGRTFAAYGLPILVVNRTFAAAQELAAELGGEAQPLDAFKANPAGADVIVTAVGGAEPIIDLATAQRISAGAPGRGVMIVDLGVPPNVDPAAGALPGLQRIGMDSVIAEAAAGRTARLGELASARLIIDEHLERLRSEYAIREAAPLIQDLTTQYQQAAVESLRRLPKNGGDEDSLRAWAETFARRLAHVPLKGLRVLAAEAGPSAVQAYLRGIHEALAEGPRGQTGGQTGGQPRGVAPTSATGEDQL